MMIDLREFDDEIILHFGGKDIGASAQTVTRTVNDTNRWRVKSYEVIEVLKIIPGDNPENLNDTPT